MKKIFFLLAFLLFTLIVLPLKKVHSATLTCDDNLNGKIIISEFSSASNPEWIELLNLDQDNLIDLSNCKLTNGVNILKNLSGTIPRSGLLTFSLNENSLFDLGDKIVLIDSNNNPLHAISYGSDTTYTTISVPNSNQSGYYDSSVWQIGTPTKGWCNPGFSGCPTINDIVSLLNSQGLKTNLSNQEDYSRINGLYFQKSETNDSNGSPIGKITFLSEMNFTDKDALIWLANLNSKIDMSSKGKIGLDAELIKNLINTNAQLTMYNLSLINPTVDVFNTDGSPGDSNIVSNLMYNNGILIFNVSHFTTFIAKERQSSTIQETSGSSPMPPICTNQKPDHAPDLFQIVSDKNSAKLFFTPVNNAVDRYFITYGFSEGDERFGVEFRKGYYDGVIDFTINDLSPNTIYYFKVRAGNGCAPGDWSNWKMTKTEKIYYEKNDLVNEADNLNSERSLNDTKESSKESVLPLSNKINESQKKEVNNINNQIKTKPNISWWQKIINKIVSFIRLKNN